MGFGNLGVSELLVLAGLVLVFFGPRRIPEVARTVGQALRQFRRGMNEIRRELDDLEREVSGEDRPRRDDARRGPSRGRVEPGDWGGGGEGERDRDRPEGPPREAPGGRRPGAAEARERAPDGSRGEASEAEGRDETGDEAAGDGDGPAR